MVHENVVVPFNGGKTYRNEYQGHSSLWRHPYQSQLYTQLNAYVKE